MKRKGSETIEDSSLIKSLRRSITNFENSIKSDNEGSSRKSIENLKAMDRLQSRLATFTVLKWKEKLYDLSPLKCAQYGWICRDSDFLQCDECKKFLCVSIPPLSKISIQVYNSCIRNCIRQLTEAHDMACSWRFAEASNFSYDILERFKELSSYEVKAPLVEPSKLNISVEQFEADKQDAILLAIFGWKIKNSDPDQLICSICGRTLNVKIFSQSTPINPIEEHYWYCPIADKTQPLWKELYHQQIETKEVNKSIAVKLAVIKSTLFDALADKVE